MDRQLEEKLDLLFKRITGVYVKDFATKYRECETSLLEAASKSYIVPITSSSSEIPIRRSVFSMDHIEKDLSTSATRTEGGSTRLRTSRNEKFWEWLNIIIRRNTDHIMDVSLIQSTFAKLKDASISLIDVEKQATALAASLGFASLEALIDYSASPSSPISMMSDQEIISKTKAIHIADLFSLLPSGAQASADSKAYSASLPPNPTEEDVMRALQSRIVAVVDHRRQRIEPMDVTPIPEPLGKKFMRRIPQKYNPAPLAQQHAILDTELNEASGMQPGQDKDAKIAAIKGKMQMLEKDMQALLKVAVGYWEKIFTIASEKKRLELMYQQEVELLAKGQVGEAERVVGEFLQYLGNSSQFLLPLPVLIGEAHRYGGNIALHIRKAVNTGFQNITCIPDDYFHILDELLNIVGNDATSVGSYLKSIEVPIEVMDKFTPLTKRNQIIAVAAFLLFARF